MFLQRVRALRAPPCSRGITGRSSGLKSLDKVADLLKESDPDLNPTVPGPESRGNEWKPFQAGAVIKPWHLSVEGRTRNLTSHFKKRQLAPLPTSTRKYTDIFHQLDINPLSQTTNPTLLQEYVTEMGKISNRTRTNLTAKSQRRIGQAIRRAKHMGLIPFLHKDRSL